MTRRPAVVVAPHGDLHGGALAHAFRELGHPVHLIELGHEPAAYELGMDAESADLSACGESVSLELASRAHLVFVQFDVSRPPWVATGTGFVLREWTAALGSIFMAWGTTNPDGWLIRPDALQMQDLKPFLLHRAAVACPSLRVPNWRMSQQVSIDPKPRVRKAINAWQEYEPGRYFNTVRLSTRAAARLASGVSIAPQFVQELVSHETEVRLYIAGERYAAVWQVRDPAGDVDLRLTESKPTQVRTGSVRDDQKFWELALMIQQAGLKYASFDLADEHGELLLLDVNPTGTWMYMDKNVDIDISRIIAEGLIE